MPKAHISTVYSEGFWSGYITEIKLENRKQLYFHIDAP